MSRVFLKISLYLLKFFLPFIKFILDISVFLLYTSNKEVHFMNNAQKIKMALAYKNMKEAELARMLGTTPQAFNQRLKTDKFTVEELTKIAEILGACYISKFEFPDGTVI